MAHGPLTCAREIGRCHLNGDPCEQYLEIDVGDCNSCRGHLGLQ